MLSFGTDGVRGAAYTQLSLDFAQALGAATADVLGPGPYLIGRDTRESGPDIESALVAGLTGAGATAELLGVAPTPAVAWLAAADGMAGAMISASHNPFGDNGIKLFAPGGSKLDDATQNRIQDRLVHLGGSRTKADPVHAVDRSADLERYIDAVVGSIQGRNLDGIRVVIDCANGSNSAVAQRGLERLGATVVAIHDQPDGRNINAKCGSTHPEDLQAATRSHGADVGLAFDGDADRVLAVDAAGRLIDGDHLIAICALDRSERGVLAENTVVVTVMTNLGFRQAMDAAGITVVETAVGDRYVLEALEAGGWTLGGEQSGHVIFRDLATTGDGLLTGVALLDTMTRTGQSLSDLAANAMTSLPQVLENVRITGDAEAVVESISDEITRVEAELGSSGRVLIRPSGTEPLVRVMVEAPTHAIARATAGRLTDAIAAQLA